MININSMEKEQYYTIEEVANMLRVGYLTVYRWVKSNKLEALRAGKQYRIKKSSLDDFIHIYERKK